MKVIVSGGTGLIGGGALRRLLLLPEVTSVVALSRRELNISDPKLETVIVKDFAHLDDNAVHSFAGAEACIWALGTPTAGMDVHDNLTFVGAQAIAEAVLPRMKAEGKTFRFIYLSGAFVETDQTKPLWFLGETRKMRASDSFVSAAAQLTIQQGTVETKLVDFASKHAPGWETVVMRPAVVTADDALSAYLLSLLGMWIPLGELSAALADVAVNGGVTSRSRMENVELRLRGQQALAKLA